MKASGYDGPKTLDERDWERAAELRRSVFFPYEKSFEDGFRTWPISLSEEYARNTIAMFHDGVPVSAVSWVTRDFITLGHGLRMGFIGGVCTHPKHRNKGLASTLLSACINRLRDDGADFVYISGARPLYYKSGANHVGCFKSFKLHAAKRHNTKLFPVNLRDATIDDAVLLASLYQREPTRFVRPILDYLLTLRHGYCSGKACTFHLIEADGEPVGYLISAGSVETRWRAAEQVLEFCGERNLVLSALLSLASDLPSDHELYVEVHRADPLCTRLSSLGFSGELTTTSGTFKALNFCQTMRKLLPYFESQMPHELFKKIECNDCGQRYTVYSAEGSLEIDGETNMLWALLGAPPEQEAQNLKAHGKMQSLVESCLPLPIPSLYLNMI
jgi:GNAT superfamily N-acetyltransferase